MLWLPQVPYHFYPVERRLKIHRAHLEIDVTRYPHRIGDVDHTVNRNGDRSTSVPVDGLLLFLCSPDHFFVLQVAVLLTLLQATKATFVSIPTSKLRDDGSI